MREVPLLCFANKQDLPCALSCAELISRLDLHKIGTECHLICQSLQWSTPVDLHVKSFKRPHPPNFFPGATHKWHIQATNGRSGDGLYEGLEVFGTLVKEYKKNRRM